MQAESGGLQPALHLAPSASIERPKERLGPTPVSRETNPRNSNPGPPSDYIGNTQFTGLVDDTGEQ